ncbi:hypothetical protein TOPH_01698 [Tolypocladium ophioglossoides CBS 100239]|uniref:Uncharacterized protein n=1 Tax=Tolypocladium ophioglossoides (strain CBS 100239) TaxID=1163406 RepID=A0A0L0NIK5_TOLOC|nr:hypothetical protein TOPH_01698 [Tolypocladium ophioglossoides CBS 100239]
MSDRPQRPEHGAPRARGTVAGVRPNLFRSQLTRRPTASSSNSAETLRLDVDVLSDTSEIVVRNQQGEIELGDPPTPVLEEQDEHAEDRQETEKERQRLVEAVKHHTINHSSVPDQPEELLEAVRADLRAKVTALAEDNWMFESEEQTRG